MIPQLFTASLADIPQIQSLATKIWQVHYPPIIGQVQVDYMLNKLYNATALELQMAEGQQFFLVKSENETVGFISISQKEDSSYFIHKFYLDTDLHGKGMGTQIFELLLQKFPQVNCIRLQVNRQNYKPINFYFKLGFVIEKVADFDIGDGYFMNDFVMVWNKK